MDKSSWGDSSDVALVWDSHDLQHPGSIRLTNQQVRIIKNLNGKYIKLLLSRLEHRFELSKDLRKTVLDTLNDYARELHQELDNGI